MEPRMERMFGCDGEETQWSQIPSLGGKSHKKITQTVAVKNENKKTQKSQSLACSSPKVFFGASICHYMHLKMATNGRRVCFFTMNQTFMRPLSQLLSISPHSANRPKQPPSLSVCRSLNPPTPHLYMDRLLPVCGGLDRFGIHGWEWGKMRTNSESLKSNKKQCWKNPAGLK